MAEVKGLTIEIGADTSKAQESLSQVNKEIKGTSNELKEVERLLKLDPTNTELLKQQQTLLGQSITSNNSKLSLLTKKLEDMKDAGVDETSKEFRKLQRDIAKVNTTIDDNSKKLKTNKKQKKESNKQNKETIKSLLAVGGSVLAISKIISDVGKTLVEWAVDGANSAHLGEQEFSNFANTLYELEEAGEQAKHSIATLILPALQDLSSSGVDVLNKISETIKNGGGTEELFAIVGDSLGELAKQVVDYAPEFVYGVVKGILTTLPKALPSLIEGVIDIVPALADAIVDSLPTVLDSIQKSVFVLIEKGIANLIEGIQLLFTGDFWKNLANIGIAFANGIIDGLNKLANMTIPALKIGDMTLWDDTQLNLFNLKKIPMLAKGGIVKSGSAIVGEAGAELLTVANGKAQVQPLQNNTTNNYYGRGEQVISINFTGSLSQLARILQPEITQQQNYVGDSLLN